MKTFSGLSDERLVEAFNKSWHSPEAFYKVPTWRKWIIGLCVTLLPMAGFVELISILEVASTKTIVMVLLGLAGGVGFFFVMRKESQYRLMREQLIAELLRRGLYEKSKVDIPAPWE